MWKLEQLQNVQGRQLTEHDMQWWIQGGHPNENDRPFATDGNDARFENANPCCDAQIQTDFLVDEIPMEEEYQDDEEEEEEEQ